MEIKNRMSEVPLANINQEELRQIQELERKMNDKYYIMAFYKNMRTNNLSSKASINTQNT